MDFYNVTKNISQLYSKLQDDLSRDVFWARLQYDIHPSASAMFRLWELTGFPDQEEMEQQRNWKNHFQILKNEGKQVFLYGAGLRGTQVATDILHDGGDFSGFIDRDFKNRLNGILGKSVYPPEHLFESGDLSYLVITTAAFENDIIQFLLENDFPQEHILPYFRKGSTDYDPIKHRQYFEFPQFYKKGTTFIDGGSYDGQDSLFFADWCDGGYSKILVFEPDAKNIKKCKKNLSSVQNVELIQAGLSNKTEKKYFSAVGKGHSRLTDLNGETTVVDSLFDNANVEEIQTFALDELANDHEVGFIKMDIEGAEMDALMGAEAIICRDKPFLAICVYHRPGDVLAIMEHLSALVPEYRFWLRHYELYANETVLYASV